MKVKKLKERYIRACQIEECDKKKEICREILKELPEWFGLPESTKEYIEYSGNMNFWADIENNQARVFIAIKENSDYTVEIYVMGVLKKFHRNKVGYNLFKSAYDYCEKQGYEFIQVKTVKEGCYKEYDITNAFYKKLGFREFECFPTLWDEWNPCQIYIKAI